MPFDMTTPSNSHATTQQQQQQEIQPGTAAPLVGLEERDFEENTPLLRATAQGDEEAVKLLLARGANLNAQNIYGYTALLTALSKGFANIVDLLLGCGASVHISSVEGLSALHMAAIHCEERVLERLLECGAFIGAQDEEGDTLLHWIIREGKRNILLFVLTKTYLLDTPNEDGETPLHFAASFGEEAMVEALLKHGANPSIKDANGLTPADHALENSHYKIAHLLKGRRHNSNSSRHDPYRRSCGDAHGDYERKRVSQHIPTELPTPTHLC
jgi:serine/threonine-protein phosphatase 6 regulatory ankyrin repeat subunit B